MLKAQEYADHVDIDDAAERLQRIVGDRLHLALDAGIVAEHVDRAKSVQRGVDVVLRLLLARDVGGNRERLRGHWQLLDGSLEIATRAVDSNNSGAALGEQFDRGAADDAGCTGDDGDPAVQSNAVWHMVSSYAPGC